MKRPQPTEFGKAIRKARIDIGVDMTTMASDLGVKASFLSKMELGGGHISANWVSRIEDYFKSRGIPLQLAVLADVSNQRVSLQGLPPHYQLLVARLARLQPSPEQITQLQALLQRFQDRAAS